MTRNEETEYGTEIYTELQGLRKSVDECSSETTNRLNYFLNLYLEEAKHGFIQKSLTNEVERLAIKFKNECNCKR